MNAETDTPETTDRELTLDELRDKQLAAGEVHGEVRSAALRRGKMTAAEQRAGVAGAKPNEGRVDNMTRRDDSDVLQGHFCIIDFGDETHGAAAKAAVERAIGEGNARTGSGDYGVYTDPGELGRDGYPLTATVLLRDEHSCLVSNVPYAALRPAQAGGRR